MILYRLLSALFAMALLLAACGSAPAANDVPQPTEAPVAQTDPTEVRAEDPEDEATVAGFPRTITDGAGRELTFEKPPERIVCFYNGCMRNLGALNHTVVGFPESTDQLDPEFADETYYPGFAANVTLLPRPGGEIDAEAVAAFRPDLIIVGSAEEVQQFESIAPVFVEYDPAGVDETLEALVDYGRMLDRQADAEAITRRVRNRYEAYKQRAPGNVSFMTVGAVGGGNFWLRTENSSECQALQGLALCDWPDPTGGSSWSYEATSEAILSLNPDVIYLANWSDDKQFEAIRAEVMADPLIQETNAYKNDRIVNVAGYDNPTAAGPMALARLLDTYMPLIYPDVFPDGPLTDEQVQEILAR